MGLCRNAALGMALVGGLALAGCASIDMARVPYTAEQAGLAEIPGMPHVRFYADTNVSVFDSIAARAPASKPVTYLALSGGGADGAFGAGLLKGLSETNRRPEFTVVSGVSTGALMAPFVFLGPRYDDTVHELYNGDLGASLIKNVNIVNGLFGNALVENDRLGHLVARFVTPDILAAVAAEHSRGRRLFVATTNLDSQRAVVWDMGAIASSGSPQALSLFRQVLTASASIPGLFPPRLVSVEAGGQSFQEMHVDGGTTQQIFVAPDDVLFGSGNDRTMAGPRDIYVLLNNKIDPVFTVVDNETIAVGTRSLQTVLKREVRANTLASYAFARRHNIGFHTAFIDADVSEAGADTFDPAFMQGLYAYGEERGRSAHPWADAPTITAPPRAAKAVVAAR